MAGPVDDRSPARGAGRLSGVRVASAVWAGLSAAGGLLLLLPDDDRRVVSFSSGHGLAPTDVVGAALLVVGWLVHLRAVLAARDRIPRRAALSVAFGVGLALVAWSVATDRGAWYLLGAATAVAAQVAAGRAAGRSGI